MPVSVPYALAASTMASSLSHMSSGVTWRSSNEGSAASTWRQQQWGVWRIQEEEREVGEGTHAVEHQLLRLGVGTGPKQQQQRVKNRAVGGQQRADLQPCDEGS